MQKLHFQVLPSGKGYSFFLEKLVPPNLRHLNMQMMMAVFHVLAFHCPPCQVLHQAHMHYRWNRIPISRLMPMLRELRLAHEPLVG